MSAPRFILRTLIFILMILVVGTILVFGFTTAVEPFYQNFGDTPDSLNWDDPNKTVLVFTTIGGLGLMLFIVIWFVSAPIRRDRRQQVRR